MDEGKGQDGLSCEYQPLEPPAQLMAKRHVIDADMDYCDETDDETGDEAPLRDPSPGWPIDNEKIQVVGLATDEIEQQQPAERMDTSDQSWKGLPLLLLKAYEHRALSSAFRTNSTVSPSPWYTMWCARKTVAKATV